MEHPLFVGRDTREKKTVARRGGGRDHGEKQCTEGGARRRSSSELMHSGWTHPMQDVLRTRPSMQTFLPKPGAKTHIVCQKCTAFSPLCCPLAIPREVSGSCGASRSEQCSDWASAAVWAQQREGERAGIAGNPPRPLVTARDGVVAMRTDTGPTRYLLPTPQASLCQQRLQRLCELPMCPPIYGRRSLFPQTDRAHAKDAFVPMTGYVLVRAARPFGLVDG